MQTFEATMDKNIKMITYLVMALVAVSLLPILFIDELAWWMKLLIVGGLIGSLWVAYLFRPKGYRITEDSLLIERGVGAVRIAIKNIVSAKAVTSADLGFGIRVFGVGGFFGNYGKYNYKKIGAVTAYVTNTSKTILVSTQENKHYLISPEDGLGFLQTLNQSANYHPHLTV
jgi:hypothetical protein